MAKRCPVCGTQNDDGLGFCSSCGEPIDANVKLVMDLDKDQRTHAQSDGRPSRTRRDNDDDYEISRYHDEDDEERKSPLLWIILGLAAAAVLWFIMK